MSTVQPPTVTPTVRNQSVGLMIFGIFQILLGCFCGLTTLMVSVLTILGPMAKTPQGVEAMNPQMMIPSLFLYVLWSVAFIWLGIGSIRARRWAWTLTVIVSWMWLIVGVFSFIVFMFFIGSTVSAAMEQQGQGEIPPGAIMVMQIVGGAIAFGLYVLLPSAFLIFYQRASVWATCQQRDPQIRWTDRCPMPVLALSLFLAFSVVSMLMTISVYGCVMPLFGHFVSGVVGATVMVLIALVLAYLAWGTYRLQMAAWWGTLLLWTAGTASMAITFAQTNLMEMYEKMGMPADQLEMARKLGVAELASQWGPWITLVFGVVWLSYLLYVRRYFIRNAESGRA